MRGIACPFFLSRWLCIVANSLISHSKSLILPILMSFGEPSSISRINLIASAMDVDVCAVCFIIVDSLCLCIVVSFIPVPRSLIPIQLPPPPACLSVSQSVSRYVHTSRFATVWLPLARSFVTVKSTCFFSRSLVIIIIVVTMMAMVMASVPRISTCKQYDVSSLSAE